MKAILLVGGEGSRLAPLSNTIPKPFLPFCNMPMVEHLILQFIEIGIVDFILAISRKAHNFELVQELIHRLEANLDITIECSIEDEVLGTGGAIAAARQLIDQCDTVFAVNSDIITVLPLGDMFQFHKSHGGHGTILATQVDDPSRFGLIEYDNETKRIRAFVEKPDMPTSYENYRINAGLYILNVSCFEYFSSKKPLSIEREVFPELLNTEKGLYMFESTGYWSDIGTLEDYVQGQKTFLDQLYTEMMPSGGHSNILYPSSYAGKLQGNGSVDIRGPVLVHQSAIIGNHCFIGPNVVLGAGTSIGANITLNECTVLEGATVDAHTCSKSIITETRTIKVAIEASDSTPVNGLVGSAGTRNKNEK